MTDRTISWADEVRSRALHATYAANVDRSAFGLSTVASAYVSPDTFRQEHQHEDPDGVLRRYVVLITVSVHTEEIPE